MAARAANRWHWVGLLLSGLLGMGSWTTQALADESANGQKVNGEKKENGNGKDKEKEEEKKHISDNSFLIEEAYNQEAGVVQHIFTWYPSWTRQNGRRRDFAFNYVMELPIGSETHQFSFTPMVFQSFSERPLDGSHVEQGGFGDMMLNYRYQLLKEDEHGWRPAVAPRLSLILPTGDEDRGLGTGRLGYQFNLPVSKEMDPFAFHFNAGFTYTPDVSTELAPGLRTPGVALRGYNLGASAIYLASYEVNFLLEFVAFWNEDLDDTGRRTRSTELILNPGIRYAVYTDDSVQWVVGIGAPIGLSKDAPDYGIFGYLSVEHTFLKKKNGNGGE